MTSKQTQYIVFGVIASIALIAAAWFFGIGPQMSNASADKAATEAAVSTTQGLSATLTSLETKEKGIEEAKADYKTLSAQFPADFELSGWLSQIQRTASANGVTITALTSSNPTLSTATPATGAVGAPAVAPAPAPAPAAAATPGAPVSNLGSSSVTLTASGSVQDLRAFVAALAKMERPLMATSVQLTADGGKSTVNVTGTTFLMKALVEPTTGSKPTEGSTEAAPSAGSTATPSVTPAP